MERFPVKVTGSAFLIVGCWMGSETVTTEVMKVHQFYSFVHYTTFLDMSYVGLFKLHARDIFYDLGGAEVLPIQPITTSREISGDLSIQPTQVPPIQPLNANIEPIDHPTGLTPFSPVSATTTAANIYASSTESTEFLSTFDTSLPSTGTPMLPELFLQPAVVPVSPVSVADSTLRPIPPAIPIAARIGSGGHVAAPIRPVSSFSEQMLSSTVMIENE